MDMYNWSTDTSKIKNKKQKTIFELEQMVNFGLGGSKLDKTSLKKYWKELNLDPDRKKFLEFVLWNKKY